MAAVRPGGEPAASVVIPTRDRPQYLREALASALGQTFEDLEVVIADDASGPETRAVLATQSDERIRVLESRQPVGQLGNTRRGYLAARGRYVALLHDDDVWEPRFLERLVPPMDADEDIALAFCDHWIIDEAGNIDDAGSDRNTRVWGRKGLLPGKHQPFLELAVITRAIPVAMGALVRRAAVEWSELPVQANLASDLWLGYAIARTGSAAWYEPERLTRYRRHGGSATSEGGLAWAQSFAWCWSQMLRDPDLAAHSRELRRRLSESHAGMAIELTALSRRREARREARAALAVAPTRRGIRAAAISLAPESLARATIRTWRGRR